MAVHGAPRCALGCERLAGALPRLARSSSPQSLVGAANTCAAGAQKRRRRPTCCRITMRHSRVCSAWSLGSKRSRQRSASCNMALRDSAAGRGRAPQRTPYLLLLSHKAPRSLKQLRRALNRVWAPTARTAHTECSPQTTVRRALRGLCGILWRLVCSAGLRRPASTHRTGRRWLAKLTVPPCIKMGGPLPLTGSPTQWQSMARPGAVGCDSLAGALPRLARSSSSQSLVGAASTCAVGAQKRRRRPTCRRSTARHSRVCSAWSLASRHSRQRSASCNMALRDCAAGRTRAPLQTPPCSCCHTRHPEASSSCGVNRVLAPTARTACPDGRPTTVKQALRELCGILWRSECSAGLRKPASTHRTGDQVACTTYRASFTKTGGPLPLTGSPTQASWFWQSWCFQVRWAVSASTVLSPGLCEPPRRRAGARRVVGMTHP